MQWDDNCQGKSSQLFKIGADPKPVFVTCEDEKLYNDVSNWNIPKLKKEIFSLIDAFTNTETTAMYLSIHNTLSKSNKRRHIKFYKEVKDELQKQLSTEKIDIDDLEYQG